MYFIDSLFYFLISVRTKFALSSRPLNIMLEILLDVEPGALLLSPPTHRKRRASSGTHSQSSRATGGSLERGAGVRVEPGSISARSRKVILLVAERICAYPHCCNVCELRF